LKNFEIIGTIECVAVLKAASKKEALSEVSTWRNAWVETGRFHQLINSEVIDIRSDEYIPDIEISNPPKSKAEELSNSTHSAYKSKIKP